MKPILSNKTGRSYFDSEKKIIHTIFFDNVVIEDGMEIFNAVLHFIDNHEIHGLFVDTTELKGSFSMINDFLINSYYKKLISKGLRFNAIVVPYDIFSYFSTENLLLRLNSLEIETFSNKKDGLDWLHEKVIELHHKD